MLCGLLQKFLLTNPLRYCGEYYDKETGTYYLRARYYNPRIGRFTARDTHWTSANAIYGDNPQKINERQDKLGLSCYSYAPQIPAIMQAGNLYVYCMGNPVTYVDRDGEIVLTAIIIGALVGAVVGGVIGGAISKRQHGEIKWEYVAGGVFLGGITGALIGWGAGAVIAKVGIASAAEGIVTGASGAGFATYQQLKNFLGSAGDGYQWHHIVEQSQIMKSGFDSFWVNNTNNEVRLTTEIHTKISAYYSSIPVEGFTNGLRFRDWLAGQSFEAQYEWGIKIIKMFGGDV